MVKIPVTISMEVELADWLEKNFPFGQKSPYVVSLIQSDRESKRSQDKDEANYATVIGMLRQLWFKENRWPEFKKALEDLRLQWEDVNHDKHYLLETLDSLSEEYIKSRISKWLRYDGVTDEEIEEVFSSV